MKEQIISTLLKHEDGDCHGGSFYAEYELNLSDIQINVEHTYPITLPLDSADIEKLLSISAAAKFGLREQTLLDKNVRDTHEVSADKLHIKLNEESLAQMLQQMRHTMGLSTNARLIPHLHNMLIYGPGQFFRKHQDSEKLHGMIATLVIVLPSPHIGGTLMIEHNATTHKFVSQHLELKKLKCIAFYSNCHHSIKKVTQGYRVAITYNVVLEPDSSELAEHTNTAFETALKQYFKEDLLRELPLKLVYLLDHTYSQHSLRWNMLKGIDRSNALAFRSAAKNLSLVPHLTLVDWHEWWSTDGHYRDPEPEELIDSEMSIEYWLDAGNTALPYQDIPIDEEEICWTKETSEFDPVNSEYEDFTGNAGSTVDYWYKRAAIVLWHQDDQISINFQLNYDQALKDLLALTESPGMEAEVINIIHKAGTLLYRRDKEAQKSHFQIFVQIASYVKDSNLAKNLLSSFYFTVLEASTQELVALQKLYGINWCIELMENNSNNRGYQEDVPADIRGIINTLIEHGGDLNLVAFLVERRVNAMIKRNARIAQKKPSAIINGLSERIQKALQLIEACATLADNMLMTKLVNDLISNPTLYPLLSIAQMLCDIEKYMQGNLISSYNLLLRHVRVEIANELKAGLRSEDDWSIQYSLPCRCKLCNIANDFLKARHEVQKVWPIVTGDRDHVMEVFDGLALPISLHVEKKGSPYKLVMVKQEKLHQNARSQFKELNIFHAKFCKESA